MKVTVKVHKAVKNDVCVPVKTIFAKMQWADLGHQLLFGYPCSRATLNRGLFYFVFPSFKWTGSRSLADYGKICSHLSASWSKWLTTIERLHTVPTKEDISVLSRHFPTKLWVKKYRQNKSDLLYGTHNKYECISNCSLSILLKWNFLKQWSLFYGLIYRHYR